MENQSVDNRSEKIPIKPERFLRLTAYQFFGYVFTKLGLLRKLKFPRAVYNSYHDNPWLFGKDLK